MESTHFVMDGASLCAIPSLLSPIVTSAEFRPGEEGWTVYAYSASLVFAVEIDMPVSAFTEYAVPAPFIVSMKDLDRLCSAVKGAKEVSLDIGARMVARANGMKVTVPTEPFDASGGRKRPREVAEKLNLGSEAVVFLSKLKGVFKHADPKICNICRVTLNKDGLTVDMTDETMGKGIALTVPMDELTAADGDSRSAFPMEGLRDLIMAIPGDPVCSIRLDEDYPMTIEFSVGQSEVMLMAAPLKEEE